MTQNPENLCNGRAAAPDWKAPQSGPSLPQRGALCFTKQKICSIFLLTVCL